MTKQTKVKLSKPQRKNSHSNEANIHIDGTPTYYPSTIKSRMLTIPMYLLEQVGLECNQPIWIIDDGISFIISNDYRGYDDCDRQRCLLQTSGKLELPYQYFKHIEVKNKNEIILSLPYWLDAIVIETFKRMDN